MKKVSTKIQWTSEQQQKVYRLFLKHQCSWANIAKDLGRHKDTQIKNKIYSTIRIGFRKMNIYIKSIKRLKEKTIKLFDESLINKVMAVFDKNYFQKFQIRPIAQQVSSIIIRLLILLAKNDQYTEESEEPQLLFENLKAFCKNCRKKRGQKNKEWHHEHEHQQNIQKERQECSLAQQEIQMGDNIKKGEDSQRENNKSLSPEKFAKNYVCPQFFQKNDSSLSIFNSIKESIDLGNKKKIRNTNSGQNFLSSSSNVISRQLFNFFRNSKDAPISFPSLKYEADMSEQLAFLKMSQSIILEAKESQNQEKNFLRTIRSIEPSINISYSAAEMNQIEDKQLQNLLQRSRNLFESQCGLEKQENMNN